MTTSPGWSPTTFGATAPGWVEGREDLHIELDGITLHTVGTSLAEGGWEFGLHRLEGWWSPAEDRTESTEHPSGDGDVAGPSALGRRGITVSGLLKASRAPGAASLTSALDRLASIRRGLLTVNESMRGIAREADVRVLQIQDTWSAPWLARVTLTLVADDPLRYGSGYKALTNGSQTLINRGNETAWPVLDIVGPHSALSIVHPGGTWTLPALATGVVRTVDFREGAVFDGSGNHVFGVGEGSGPLPRVPAGGASWTVSGVGSGSIRARRTEAWS